MYEIRWHGRGGGGIITASEVLAFTALKENKFFQSFPDFGPERMGAPIRAYTRIDDKPINIHSQVYEPDAVVVLDPTLLDSVNVSEGLKERGVLIVNTPLSKDEIKNKLKFQGNLYVINATKIAMETIGRPIANICGVGALLKVSGIVNKENLISTIKETLGSKFSEKVVNGNVNAALRGYNEVN